MAKIISLALKVADVHRDYAVVHGAVFGAGSIRRIFNGMTGRHPQVDGQYIETLECLGQKLTSLEADIRAIDKPERSVVSLHSTLLEYTRTLSKIISELIDICGELQKDEQVYRESADNGKSRYSLDKIEYDQTRSRLERLGTRLNQLFSSL